MSKITEKQRESLKQAAVWIATVIISVILLYLGNMICTKDLDIFTDGESTTAKAVVTELGEKVEDSYSMSDDLVYSDAMQYFNARVLSGNLKGQILLAAQTSDNYVAGSSEEKVIEPGDKVILYNYGTKQGDADWVFGGYARFEPVMWLMVAFFVLLIIFGQIKGLNTIVSLGFTVLAVFAVFIPAVLSGFNIYLMTIIICVYTIIMTLLITNGATAKSFTTILGCTFGVLLAAALEILFDRLMMLTGITDEHSIYLQYLSSGVEIDLKALIFAMVVIGAMGAVMDVAMDISSSLAEVHFHAPHLGFMELVKSGLTIGKDIMGTMANTLVLAYIGSSLCSILLMITYSSSLMELLNRENIAVEVMQSLIGSTAILLTIPLTSIVCAVKYTSSRHNGKPGKAALVKTDIKTTEEEYKDLIPEEKKTFYYDGSTKA